MLAFPINPPSLGQSFRNPPLQLVVQAPTYEELDKLVDAMIGKARAYPGLANVDSDPKLNEPLPSVELYRDKASALGADVDTIGGTLETMLGSRQVTRFKREGKQYDVIVQLEDKDRARPTDLTAIYVRGRDHSLVQLSNLVKLRETVAPKELNHFDRQRAAIISANIAPGYTLGDIGALAALNLTGGTLNVYSKAGLVMLIRLVTKNGILIVEFANQPRDKGMDKLEAVIEAAALRLRPVLMTSFATVLGAVPLAVAIGAGAESRQPIGRVIVGGALAGTLLTLFIIPVFDTLLVGRRRKRLDEESPAPARLAKLLTA